MKKTVFFCALMLVAGLNFISCTPEALTTVYHPQQDTGDENTNGEVEPPK